MLYIIDCFLIKLKNLLQFVKHKFYLFNAQFFYTILIHKYKIYITSPPSKYFHNIKFQHILDISLIMRKTCK